MILNDRSSILCPLAYTSVASREVIKGLRGGLQQSLLNAALGCSVRVIHIDSPGFETDEALRNELRHYDAVVCGPGPGDPSNQKDVGLMSRIWKLKEEDVWTSWAGAEDSSHWGN